MGYKQLNYEIWIMRSRMAQQEITKMASIFGILGFSAEARSQGQLSLLRLGLLFVRNEEHDS